jgi:hypothetical protein
LFGEKRGGNFQIVLRPFLTNLFYNRGTVLLEILSKGIQEVLATSALMTQLAFGQTPQDAAPNQDETSMKIRIEFNRASMTATLYDNPSARDFASMLPLDLTIDDYSTNEKIAYLPRKLTEEDGGPFGNEAPGDLAYYAPWGNLAFFYGATATPAD